MSYQHIYIVHPHPRHQHLGTAQDDCVYPLKMDQIMLNSYWITTNDLWVRGYPIPIPTIPEMDEYIPDLFDGYGS